MQKKISYHHGKLKKAIINETIKQLNLYGIKNISFRAIAREVGVASSAPYNHFNSKEDLFLAISQLGKKKLFTNLDSAQKKSTVPSEKLALVAKAYLNFSIDEKPLFELMFSKNNLDYRNLTEDINLLFEKIVSSKFKTGTRKRVTINGAAFCAWSMIHGLASILSVEVYDNLDDAQKEKIEKTFSEMSVIWGRGVAE